MAAPLLAIPFPAIDPVLIEVGPFALRWYALAYIAGILIGWRYAMRLAGRADLNAAGAPPVSRETVDDFLLFAALGVIVGGRLGFVLFYNPAHYAANPLEIFKVWQGGMAFHGGFLGVVVAAAWFARARGVSPLALGDLIAAAAPIGIFFGRIANFINGELWGRPSDVPWAMVFPLAGPEPRHPSQLYEAALEGLVLFLILRLATHRFGALARPGTVIALFLIGYGLARSLAELFRMPDAAIGFLPGGLTMGIALSLPMVVAGIALLAWTRRTPRP